MKRLSGTIAAAGVLALGLTACGGHTSAPNATGPSSSAQTTASSAATTATSTPAAPQTSPATSSAPQNTALGPASRTPCREFKDMDIDAEKTLMEKVLAENPGSHLDGSPDVALGTAKLVCQMHSQADTPVAVAIRVAHR
jgi:hypothetical protein